MEVYIKKDGVHTQSKSFVGGRLFFVFIGFLVSLFFLPQTIQAATVTWVGTSGTWETASKWSSGSVPTSTDDVIINSSTSVTVTLSSGQLASFNTLTIGGGSSTSTLILVGNIGTGGSINIDSNGRLTQSSTVAQTITGTLTILNGGTLTHATNTTAQARILDFTAQNIDLQSGGSIDVSEKGYAGVSGSAGNGPGGGGFQSTSGGASGAHGGDGGNSYDGSLGAVSYCDITNVNTMGSSGASSAGTSGAGGGLIRLTVIGTTTLNGSITATGGSGTNNFSTLAGGAGGGVKIVANIVTGTPTTFSVAGARYSNGSAGGAGGCVQISYTTSNSITASQISMEGATGGSGGGLSFSQTGGGGLLYIKQTTATYGDLYSLSTNSTVSRMASTTLVARNFTLNSLTLNYSKIVVSSTNALTFSEPTGNPFANSSSTASGTLYVQGTLSLGTSTISNINLVIGSGAVFTNSSTLILNARAGLSLYNGASLSSSLASVSSSGSLYLERGGFTPSNMIFTINSGTVTMGLFTTSTPRLELNSLTMNGGTLTHSTNTTDQSNIINISALNITIATSASINVDGAGYSQSTTVSYATGNGPGGGGPSPTPGSGAGGGSHAGVGGTGGGCCGPGSGGSTYGDITNINTMGSGGGKGSASSNPGGAGGGLVILNATSTFTLNGTISAKGNGVNPSTDGGGGAGGGIRLVANILVGTSTGINVSGGRGGSGGSGGGGGGGYVQILYRTSNVLATSSITKSGGAASATGAAGSTGQVAATQSSNSLPTTTPSPMNTPSQVSATVVQVTTTVSDTDWQVTTLTVQYSTNGGTTWASSTLGTITPSIGSVSTSSGQITGIGTDNTGSVTLTIPWFIGVDIPNTDTTTVKLRFIPNDGVGNGATNTSANFSVDTKKPTLPGNLGVFLIASSSVRLTFPSVTSTDTNFTDYRIFYSTTTPVTNTLSTLITSSTDTNLGSSTFSGATSTLITGLSNSTLYYFNLYAYDQWGNNTSSLTQVSTTTGAGYLVPYNLSATLDSGTQVTISWSGNTPQYYVENTTNGTNSGWINSTSYSFTGLGCGTNFTFKVKGRADDLTETVFSSTVTAPSTASCPSGGGSSGGAGGSSYTLPTPTTTTPTTTSPSNPTFPTNTTQQPEDPSILNNRIERIKQYCPNLKPGDEVKVVGKPAIFILGQDYRPRYFPSGNIYKTYKQTYGGYIKISETCITKAFDMPTSMPTAIMPRAGSVLVTFGKDTTNTYAIFPNYALAPITTEAAKGLYGTKPTSTLNLSERDYTQFTIINPPITTPIAHPGMTITIKEENNSTIYYVDSTSTLQIVPRTSLSERLFLPAFVYTVNQSATLGMVKRE